VRKKILLAVVVSGATLLLAMLAAEIYLRQRHGRTSPQPYAIEVSTHDGQKISPQDGSVKLALAPFTVYRNLPSQHTPAININSRGLRAEEGDELDSRPKIIFLGGSAAFGQGAETDQDTIPAILQQSIKSHRVLNAGVIGFQSGQELTYLVTQLIDYQPAIVVAYDGWNDVFDVTHGPERDVNDLGFNSNFYSLENQLVLNYRTQVSPYESLSRLIGATSSKSLVLTRFTQAISTHQRQEAITAQASTNQARGKALLNSVVTTYVNNVRKMAVFSRASGAGFVVVFQPELGQRLNATAEEKQLLSASTIGNIPYGDSFPSLYREFLTETKQQLTRAGVEWIDTNESPLYQASPATLFLDPVHTNRRGNEIVAEIIAPKLRLLIAQLSQPTR
jgi:lysophospholipase L1-like esterase